MLNVLLFLALAVAPPDSAQAAGDTKLVEMYVRNGVSELGLDARTPEGREKIRRLERAVREDLRDREIVLAEARRRGLPVAGQLDERRRQWIARLGGEAAHRAYLAEHDLSAGDFDRIIQHEIAGELLREALARDVRVSQEEVAAFYAREKKNPALEAFFVEPEQVTAGHILIAGRKGIHQDLDARRARAERIRRELLAGQDFAELARTHSDDAGTRARGGDLGSFPRSTHTAPFDTAAFALAPGETSAVVQTEYGFHIIRVTAKHPQRVRTIEELRDAIEARLRGQQVARHLRAWLEEQRTRHSAIPH